MAFYEFGRRHPESQTPENRVGTGLPPTPITIEAERRLSDWGIPADLIHAFQLYTARFRYDQVAVKLGEIQTKGVSIEKVDDWYFATIAKHFRAGPDVTRGECGVIAISWNMGVDANGLLAQFNAENRLDKDRIVGAYYQGKSKTHFFGKHDRHSWSGLARVNPQGRVVEEIYSDASFQTIMTPAQSGYDKRTAVYDYSFSPSIDDATIPLGGIQTKKSRFAGASHAFFSDHPVVLGVSDDFQLVYSLGFAKLLSENQFMPYLERIVPEGLSDHFYLHEGKLMHYNPRRLSLDSTREKEIRYLLGLAAQIPIQYQD